MVEKKVGIVGATGYTGSELVRLLKHHPEVSLEVITSRSNVGDKFSDIHPQFKGLADMKMEDVKNIDKYSLDLVFLALPHTVSMDFVKEKGTKKYKIVDLSGDFRLKSVAEYEKWYKTKHTCPKMVKQAAFGLPELFRSSVRKTRLVANPGCYPTSAILALAPLLRQGVIDPKEIIVDSKSGVTGAGAKVSEKTHFPDVFGDFKAYSLHHHRHTPEIEAALKDYTGMKNQTLFTPHLLPVDRGILTTTYTKPKQEVNDEILYGIFETFYRKEYFVRILDNPPSIKNVRGSNFCDLHVSYDERTNKIITVSALDNLVKGAAGQAIQNMNIMLDLIERTGLQYLPLSP